MLANARCRAGVYGSSYNPHLALTIFSDDDPALINKLSPEAIHRNVDLAVLEATQKLEAKFVIFIPATTYGQGYG
jgi:hypothetical protein